MQTKHNLKVNCTQTEDMAQLRPTFSRRMFQHALDNHVRQYSYTMKDHELGVRRADQPCGLHACLRHAMRLARWTGFLPVQGLGQTSADRMRFKIKCVYSCYCIATLIGQVVMSCFTILLFFESKVDLSTISNIVFYVTGLISAILLLKLSQQWPLLMAIAAETEQGLTELKLDNKTVVLTTAIAYVIMTLALVEHILCTSFNMKFVIYCLEEASITSLVMEHYVVHRMPFVFNYIPYSIFSAILFEFMCLQATFLWSFNDVMVTCFSIYITAYLQNLNEVIAANIKKGKDGIPWSTLRVHYSNLVKLIKFIDVQISSFILISFFTDLSYICLQIFNSLHRSHVSFKYCDEIKIRQALSSPDYLLYYLFSVVFLVLRALMLSLYASNVHYVALQPIFSVYDVPTSLYDVEVQRFQSQLHHTEVALSGKFFYVTRNMILKVVGTIITYEMVLLQNSVTPDTYYNGTTTAIIVENITNNF